MRLLFLNRCFGPEAEATGKLLAELCADLARVHRVVVVAGPDRGGRRWLARESVDGVEVARTWGTRLSKASMLGRLANLGTYYVLALAAARRLGPADVVVAETDPPLLGLLGAMLKRAWGCGFVYYCQDLYPDVAEVTGAIRSRLLLRLLRWANGVAYAEADRIIVLADDMRGRLLEKGIRGDRIVVVPNWADTRRVRPGARGGLRDLLGDRFVVMYSGNMGLTQPLDVVLHAAARLRREARVAFALVGEGVARDRLRATARRAGLDNVHFLPFQPSAELAASLGAGDLHIVPLGAGLAGCLVPSKVYGILAVGRPVVALMQADAEVARLVRGSGTGFQVEPDDVDGLVDVIRRAMADPGGLAEMGTRARRLAEERFDRVCAVARFAAVVEEVAGTPAALRFSAPSR